MKKAAPLLGDEPVFVINSDILWTDDGETALDRLTRHWDARKWIFCCSRNPSPAPWATTRRGPFVHQAGEHHQLERGRRAVYHRGHRHFSSARLRDAPDGKFSVKILWHRAMEQNRLFCLPHYALVPDRHDCDIRKTEEELRKCGQ